METIKPTKQKPISFMGAGITELDLQIENWLNVKETEKQPIINHICMNNEGTKVLIIYAEREPITPIEEPKL